MKHIMATVYDSKAAYHMPPFFVKTKNEAIRAFKDAVSDSRSPFHSHPEDFTLFLVGEFDDSTGTITNYDATLVS